MSVDAAKLDTGKEEEEFVSDVVAADDCVDLWFRKGSRSAIMFRQNRPIYQLQCLLSGSISALSVQNNGNSLGVG